MQKYKKYTLLPSEITELFKVANNITGPYKNFISPDGKSKIQIMKLKTDIYNSVLLTTISSEGIVESFFVESKRDEITLNEQSYKNISSLLLELKK